MKFRFTYCYIYTHEFRDLVNLYNNRTNLLILGYDWVDTEITGKNYDVSL